MNRKERRGQAKEAQEAIKKAANEAAKADEADGHRFRAKQFAEEGKIDEATEAFRQAISIDPDNAAGHFNLGVLLRMRGQPDEATGSFLRAAVLQPDFTGVHYHLGNALLDLEKFKDAVASYHKALAIEPDYAEVHYNLGIALKELGRADEAIASYQKAIALNPGYAEALNNLGNAYFEMGEADEARKCFAQMLELDGESLKAEIKSLLCFPAIVQCTDEILSRREALANALETIGANGETLENPFKDIGLTNFLLAYHDLNDRPLQRAIADMYLRVAPSLNWRTPEKAPGRVTPDRIRIGFLSAYLNNHTIGKLNRGLIDKLDRSRFEVVVFRFPHEPDELSTLIEQSADRVVALQKNLETARGKIAALDLDILFYPEIGMDPFTYFLAFSRLAPVQVVSWGHPDTTGIPNIDYFLSSRDLETPEADDHYTEKLIRLEHLPVFSYPARGLESPPGRAHFGLPEEARLYVVAQTLFKFHPDFDAVLGALLRADPDGRLVLISDNNTHWDGLLRRRFKASFPKQADRVIFVPRMDGDDFMGLLGVADALLDTPHFGGGNTSFEAFSAGIPIVSWPTALMRGRVTFAQYRAMGIKELIAENAETYIDLALRLAGDLPFREEMKKRIAENNHHLFERHEAVRDMESFFIAAVEASRNNSELEDW